MKNILDTLKTLQNTPVPNLLVIAGFIFLLLAFVGKFGAIIELPSKRQKWAGIIGGLLLMSGIILFLVPIMEPTSAPDPYHSPSPSPTPTQTEALIATGLLQTGKELLADNKLYSLKLESNGNLIVNDNTTGRSLWSSNTEESQADHLVMQDDGNLVLYTKSESPVWQSKTNSNQGDYFLLMQDDGNLVIYRGKLYSGNVSPIWATNTSR